MFKEGDLVLRKVESSRVGQKGNLAPNWEGPYRVKHLRGPGAYKLEILEGDEVPRIWHASNLKVYYIYSLQGYYVYRHIWFMNH